MTTIATFGVSQDKTGSDGINHTEVTIVTDQVLAEMVPLGQVTATGKFIESKADASDGSQVPKYLTSFAVDATGADKQHMAIKSGTFDPTAITWDASWTAAKKLTAFVGTAISLQTTDEV